MVKSLALDKKSNGTSTSVKIKGLTKKFSDKVAVNDANIDVDAGDFMTFLGPSGCGKTTILSMILGMIEPTSGNVTFDNNNIINIPMNKRNVGMVFQNYALFPHMTVEKNIAFGLDMRNLSKNEQKRQVNEIIELVQLNGLERRFPKELSGGQQQRVALARALVIKPKVLLLDEPLSNLDAKLRKEMRVLLKKLHEELNVTTIFVTHDQEEALSLSTKITVLSEGIIQQIGTPQDIFLRPKNKFVANFVGYTNFLSGEIIDKKNGSFIFKTNEGYYLEVTENNRYSVGDAVTLTIKPENIQLVDGDKDFNTVNGEVVVSEYMGNTTDYIVASESGVEFKVNVLSFEPYPTGKKVKLFFDPDQLLILDKE